MESCIYRGILRHRRFRPAAHAFEYPLFMMYLDLDELPELFTSSWLYSATGPAVASFRRRDHLGSEETPLKRAVEELVGSRAREEIGSVRLLTHLSYFGYRFNPVSFYYGFRPSETDPHFIIAEINNTPWGEQHSYLLTEEMNSGRGGTKRFLLDKEFHVSPFMDMDMRYDWRFTAPGERLVVHMENLAEGSRVFDATLRLERQPITPQSLRRVLWDYPLMTARVMAGIYWQAFKLWSKGFQFFPHPDKRNHSSEEMATR